MKLLPLHEVDADSQYKCFYEQSGGSIPVFSGAKYQRGHGIGSILSGVMKMALPVLKKGALTLGKTTLSTGMNIARDKLAGKSLQQSFQDNLKIAGSDLVSRAMNSFSQPRKRQAPPRRGSSYKRKRPKTPKSNRRQTKSSKDIFS